MTWDCSVALSESSQVQPFIWFWQAAQFIIKATAEARCRLGANSRAPEANIGLVHKLNEREPHPAQNVWFTEKHKLLLSLTGKRRSC